MFGSPLIPILIMALAQPLNTHATHLSLDTVVISPNHISPESKSQINATYRTWRAGPEARNSTVVFLWDKNVDSERQNVEIRLSEDKSTKASVNGIPLLQQSHGIHAFMVFLIILASAFFVIGILFCLPYAMTIILGFLSKMRKKMRNVTVSDARWSTSPSHRDRRKHTQVAGVSGNRIFYPRSQSSVKRGLWIPKLIRSGRGNLQASISTNHADFKHDREDIKEENRKINSQSDSGTIASAPNSKLFESSRRNFKFSFSRVL